MFAPKVVAIGILSALALPLAAQVIPDGTTNTIVQQNKVSGGTVSGSNLFHSFTTFNVGAEGVEFVPNGIPGVRINNIFIRVTGQAPSYVQNVLNTKKGFPNANLYLVNAQGLVFQEDAKLEVGGSVLGTTATGIGFADRQVVTPKTTVFPSTEVSNLEFAYDRAAPILNPGELGVAPGRNLALVGGAVFSDGNLMAPNGNVAVMATTGGSRVEVRATETNFGLTVIKDVIEPVKEGVPEAIDVLRPAFPELPPEAKTIVVRPDGKVTLLVENQGLVDKVLADGRVDTTGAFTLLNGDVALKGVTAANIQVDAPSDIVLLVPQISAGNNVVFNAGSTITFRDSLAFASNLATNGNLVLRGDGRIDFLAVNHPQSVIKVGGNLLFLSRRDIWADSVFAVGGRVLVEASPSETIDIFAPAPPLPRLLQPSPRLSQ
ncbi:MAG: filamentous hemagglutinin N-terminal domain-containing protein [Pseudanabaenaceae cyanobacterium]